MRKLGGQVEQLPAERLGVQQCAMGERIHREFVCLRRGRSRRRFPVRVEDAVAHLGGGGFGEGDGDDLAGLLDLGQQAQKAAGEQVGLARAGRGLHQNGLAGIERALALRLIGRRGLGCELTHRRPPRCRIVLGFEVRLMFLNAAKGLQTAALAGFGGFARVDLGLSAEKILGQSARCNPASRGVVRR